MDLSPLLFSYVGPDTWLPLTSALAAVSGVMLMGGRRGLSIVRGLIRRLVPGGRVQAPHGPHRRLRAADAQQSSASASE